MNYARNFRVRRIDDARRALSFEKPIIELFLRRVRKTYQRMRAIELNGISSGNNQLIIIAEMFCLTRLLKKELARQTEKRAFLISRERTKFMTIIYAPCVLSGWHRRRCRFIRHDRHEAVLVLVPYCLNPGLFFFFVFHASSALV